MNDGSAAYDLRIGEEGYQRPRRQRKTRAAAFSSLRLSDILIIAAVAFMIITMLFFYKSVYESKTEVARLKSQITRLSEEQELLRGKYDGQLNFSEIEKTAVQLGMSKPTGCETVYINLAEDDRGEVLGGGALTMTSVLHLAGEAFTHLTEYFAQPET